MTHPMRERLLTIILESVPFDTLRLDEKLRDYDAPRLLDALLAELREPDGAMVLAVTGDQSRAVESPLGSVLVISQEHSVAREATGRMFTAMIDAVRAK